jgi:hypothetical protein
MPRNLAEVVARRNGSPNACGGLRSAAADVQVAVLAGPVVQHLNQRVARIGTIRFGKKARCAPGYVVGASVEAKLPFPPFRPGGIGGAEG